MAQITIKYLFILIFSFFFLGNVAAQKKGGSMDVTGLWKGTLTQNAGGFKSEYSFELYLIQKKGKIRGRSYFYVDDVFATIELSGTIKGGKIVILNESEIVDYHKYEDMEICLKNLQLTVSYDGKKLQLNGFWDGKSVLGDCIPGKIFLTKQVPRA